MSGRQPVTLDCIIFGMQRFGGISNYWARLVDHAFASPLLSPHLVLPKQLLAAEFASARSGSLPPVREGLPTQMARYLRAPVPDGNLAFHTSYYRLPRGQVSRYLVSAYDFTYERYRSGPARFVHSTQKLASLLRADVVLCISHSTKQDVLEFCPGIDPARLHVTHLGVDPSRFFRDAGADVGNGANSATVLFVGQRRGYKRFDLAVDAVRRCRHLELGVVGPALTPAERDMMTTALGVRWREFGPVDAGELRRLYSTAFAFIFPSDYEGFGLPVLEAMACGCPVVAANKSSLPEVGAGAARYASEQRADAYASHLEALADPTARGVAVRAGVRRAAEFSWAKTFDQTFSHYVDTPRLAPPGISRQ